MKQDLIVSISFYICGSYYTILGAYVIITNVKSKINSLFILILATMATWSFAYSIAYSAPTAEESAFWRCIAVFGWGVFYSVLLHFILILTKTEIRIDKRIVLIALYLPALINIILFAPFGFLAETQFEMVKTELGWVNVRPADIWGVLFNLYYIVTSILAIALTVRWHRKLKPHTLLKRQVTIFLISLLGGFFVGSAIDVLPGIIGINPFPKVAIEFLVIPVTMLFLAARNYGVFLERRGIRHISLESAESLNNDRKRLFRTVSAVFVIVATISFLIRYFGMKEAFISEFILAGTLLISGLFISFIPYITKSHTMQNTIFLVLSILAMLYFTITNIKTAATSIWAAYIVFLLFTVILDSKVHANAFVISSIVIQIVFWLAYSKVSVIIDGNEYATRIFIIALSFFAVRYVTTEYDSKIKGFKRFSKEQETLEKISSSFISVDGENVKLKIDELLVESFEILEFDNAYLVDFDSNYETATISNIYVKDIEDKSFPFYPGAKFKTANYPLIKLLTERNTPITVEDITDIPIDENEQQRSFFLSRGIRSFFALPITADENVTGMLVVEYKERNDIRFTESRLHFLIILANIIGDTGKKLQYERMLYNIAYFDESTKLANRNMFKRKLAEIISDSKEDKKIAVFDIELENLRMINDTFGHAVGEQVMIESAKILNKLLEECCYVSRTGEGEFAVVLPDIEANEEIEECTEKLLSSFSHPISTESGVEALFVIVGIGISVYPEHGRDADTLLKNADLAGYEARNTERDYVFYNDKMQSDISETTLLTNKLFRSLENKEFSLEYQPQISCETGKAVGFEALLRWTTDDNRRIPPNRFIPMLEQTGLIYDVGLWVLEEALKEHRKLVEKGFSPLRVSVNLSVVQFEGENFISDFTRVIKGSGVDPEYIELEITESLFSKDPTEVLEKLFKLKELGIKIAIDDFGSGYSSLNRLKLIPFDRIKIDKAIIDHIDLDEKSAPITKTIILLAEAFKAGITAEGVETKEQAEFLKNMLCGEIQGYYYSRPLTSEVLEEFLRNEAG